MKQRKSAIKILPTNVEYYVKVSHPEDTRRKMWPRKLFSALITISIPLNSLLIIKCIYVSSHHMCLQKQKTKKN